MVIYKDLEGKRVVITGGASGIGFATAERFVDEKSKVFIIDWDQEALDKAAVEIPELVGGVLADVSNPKDVEQAFKQVDELLGGLDILISNAGVSFRNPFLEIDYEQWSKVLRINLDGMFLCS
ncbi:MAG: SDR family NAD(P)-dependent oxidoreductase, partial [Candidatus Heimdallarchaeota archaeon]